MQRYIEMARNSDRLGLVASALAVAACYGTLAALGTLSLMGMTLTLHEGAWAGTIVFFALLALAGITLGRQRHGRSAPTILALFGAALILWVMLAQYARLVELAGFALLVGGAVWDWRLAEQGRREENENG